MADQCPRCIARGQTWSGDAPKCGFTADGHFRRENWNCATLNALRDLCDVRKPVWQEDQYYACLPTWDACDWAAEGVFPTWPLTLWVSWYKRRGATDAIWLLYDDREPTVPTLAQVEAILTFHERTTPR